MIIPIILSPKPAPICVKISPCPSLLNINKINYQWQSVKTDKVKFLLLTTCGLNSPTAEGEMDEQTEEPVCLSDFGVKPCGDWLRYLRFRCCSEFSEKIHLWIKYFSEVKSTCISSDLPAVSGLLMVKTLDLGGSTYIMDLMEITCYNSVYR